MQKEEGLRGMAKEDRLCSMLNVICEQLSCFLKKRSNLCHSE